MTVTQLRTLGNRLLNIHGQHDGQQLLDETQHIIYLDQYGRYMPLQIAYSEKFAALQDIQSKISALQMDESEKARRIDTLQFQIKDLLITQPYRMAVCRGCAGYTEYPFDFVLKHKSYMLGSYVKV